MHRFYIPDFDPTDRAVAISNPVARQLKTVLRATPGDRISVFDGSGGEWELEIEHVGKTEVSASLVSAIKPIRSPSKQVTLLLGLARPERIELAIQKCTELGATSFIPVMSERVQGGNTGEPSDKRLERWRRITVEASEQSGRVTVPELSDPMPLREAVKLVTEEKPLLCLWEESDSRSNSLQSALHKHSNNEKLAALIGPPGGLSSDEVEEITSAGADLVTMGPRILRSETAAITVMSAILFESGDLGGA